MKDREQHAESVQRAADRLTAEGVPVEHEEGFLVVTDSDGEGNYTTETINEDGATTGHDVWVDFRPVEETDLPEGPEDDQ